MYARTTEARPRRAQRPALGDTAPLGPDALAIAAQAIVDAAPPGSGVNPITQAMQDAAGYVNILDTQYGGTRAVPFYWANPITDPSGLILWQGADSCVMAPGLTGAQLLAAQVLLNHGDTSWSADYHPPNLLQFNSEVNATANVVQTDYSPPPMTQVATPLDQFGKPYGDAVITTQTAAGAIDAVTAAGGDPAQWTNVVDAQTGSTVGIVRQTTDGTIEMQPGAANHDVAGVVNNVTGFIDKVAGTISEIGTQVQKVGNAIQGGAAGAQVGYNAPVNWRPWAIGAGAFVLAMMLSTGSRRR